MEDLGVGGDADEQVDLEQNLRAAFCEHFVERIRAGDDVSWESAVELLREAIRLQAVAEARLDLLAWLAEHGGGGVGPT